MKRVLALLVCIFSLAEPRSNAQTICNTAGNMIVYSNYDGGTLNINVDVNIPNLVIGVVSYEAVAINISGTFASNVTAVRYAGYNSANNNHCVPNVSTTAIAGAPTGAITSIVFLPPSTITNINGDANIVCAYSCNTTTNQGGCNTADQIAGYFQSQFPTAPIRYHKTQYGCWIGTQNVSGMGNCCAGVTTGPPPSTLAVNATATNISCNGQCTATLSVVATGGAPQYSYQWLNGPSTSTWTNRCAGTYYVAVTDGVGTVRYDTVVASQPAPIATTISQTACSTYTFNGTVITTAGQYKDTLTAANGCDSIITLNLTLTPVNVAVTQAGATLTAVAPPPATYQWLRCTGTTTIAYTILTGAMTQTYTAAQNGQYAVRVLSGLCADTSTCRSVTTAGVYDASQQGALRVYPNPISGDYFTIEAPKAFAGAAFTITDATGRVVKNGALRGIKTDVRVAGLATGTYLLRIAGMERAAQLVR